MLTLGLRRPITSVVIDITQLHDLPDPDALAEALARAVGRNALFSRAACVAHTPDQQQFAATFKQMTARPDEVGVFDAEADAVKWLGIDPATR